jgi:hypothetical protein
MFRGKPRTQPIVPVSDAEAKKRHEELYLRAHAAQESSHLFWRRVGKAFAFIAAFIPPISIPYMIYSVVKNKLRGSSFFDKFSFVLVAGLIPILSGFMVGQAVRENERRRRLGDDILKYRIFRFDGDGFKTNKRLKGAMVDFDRELLKPEKLNKPKKVKIINKASGSDSQVYDIYMDHAQRDRRDAYIDCCGKKRPLTFFQESYKKSAEIVERLERKYQPEI